MTSKDMCYWLQGFFELSETDELTPRQVEIIKNHLKLVFYYEIDSSYSADKEVQAELQNIHDGTPTHLKPRRNSGDVIVKC